jgi:hypothetical protein
LIIAEPVVYVTSAVVENQYVSGVTDAIVTAPFDADVIVTLGPAMR